MLAVALFVCRAIAADAIVPSWQGPDEPAHFSLAKLLSEGGETPARRVAVEREVMASMARHRWWQPYGLRTPDPVPQSFAEVPASLAPGTLLQPAYYALAAVVLRVTPASGIDGEFTTLRWLSVALGVAALLCGWAGTRRLFGPLAASGAVAIAALNPQFLLSAITVSPDALINLCGAVIWWQVAALRDAVGWAQARSAALVLAAGLIAALSKRNGIPVLAVAVLAVGAIATRSLFRRAGAVLPVASTVGVLIGGAAVVWIVWREPAQRLLTFWSYLFVLRRSAADIDLSALSFVVTRAIDASWLWAGWMRFPAPDWWFWIVRALTIGGLIGALTLTVRRRLPQAGWAWLFVLPQLAALVSLFMLNAGPQGRYFFGAFMPVATLIWLGLVMPLAPGRRPRAAVAVIAGLAALDLAGFGLVLVPAYVR
ncbi:MAG: hypothetical protein AB7P99_03430 [Vicinamibacterales bacterium]